MRLQPRNPMERVLSVTLWFEVVVFGLAIPGMIQVSDVAPGVAFAAGGAAMLLAAVAAVLLRRGPGYELGWLAQAAGIALGLLVSMMYLMGVIFAVLWVVTFALGRKLDARAAQ